MHFSNTPNPRRPVTQYNYPQRATQSASTGLGVDPCAKGPSLLDRPHIGGRPLITHWLAFLIQSGLRKYASQLRLSGSSLPVGRLPHPAFCLDRKSTRLNSSHVSI